MSRRLKVALLDLWSLTPYYERYLLQALQAEGADAHLYTTDYPTAPDYYRDCGVKLASAMNLVGRLRIKHEKVRRVVKSAEYLLNQSVAATKWLVGAPDVVHVQWLPLYVKGGLDRLFLRYLKRRNIPLVYTVHNLVPHDAPASAKESYKALYAQMDRLICHTQASVEELHADFGIPMERIALIPHGPIFHDLPRPTREQARKTIGLSEDDIAVLWQGVVSPYKGIQLLLEAWVEVQRRNPRAKLIVAGTGKQEFVRQIENRVAELGIDQSVLQYLRFIEPEEMPLFFIAADVLVYPYSEITTSGALMTGLTYHKPTIASDLAGFREVLPDDAASFVPVGDAQALAQGLCALIDSPERRHAMAARIAELRIENAWHNIARRTMECYEEAIAIRQNALKKKQASAMPACRDSQKTTTLL